MNNTKDTLENTSRGVPLTMSHPSLKEQYATSVSGLAVFSVYLETLNAYDLGESIIMLCFTKTTLPLLFKQFSFLL